MLQTGKTQEKRPSERSFGLLFALIFCALGTWGAVKNWPQFATITLFIVGAGLFPILILKPQILAPFNKAWFLLGEMLGKIVSPIILGLIFFLMLTPIALIGKVIGRDALKLKKRKTDSYWVDREPSEPLSDSFKNQF
jgi:uncharacterized YccA/Bax inhibitor family protein